MPAEREYFPGAVPYDLRMEAATSKEPWSGATDQVRAGQQAASDQPASDDLDGKTKDELLQEAEFRGVEVKTSSTKDEILKALRQG